MVDTNATAAKANETMNQGIETTREYTERARGITLVERASLPGISAKEDSTSPGACPTTSKNSFARNPG